MWVPMAGVRNRILGRKRQVFFIHVPKCGGSFVEDTFLPYIRQCETLTLPDASGHKLWLEYRDVFREHGIDITAAVTFAVVRNPWDWHVSWFHYIRDDEGGRKSGHRIEHEQFRTFSFADYIDWLEDPAAERSPQGYIVRQLSDWVVDESGNIVVDHVLRQENLEEDLAKFVREAGLAIKVKHKRVNASAREDYRSYYDDRTAEIIRRRHQRDIRFFGYSF